MHKHCCGRFAPSPTGPLHLGSLVAAVGSYCQARNQSGQWLVRMEDLDLQRTVTGASDAILRTLENYALYWDHTVIYQSRRGAAYQEALNHLQSLGIVYACSCTRREIADIAQAGPSGPIYPGTCRRREHHGAKPVALRITTESTEISMIDRVQGACTWNLEQDIGDFVIQRADGQFAYQLAVVVDDAEQEVTEVVRGADLLSCTPMQIHLQQLLTYPTPGYLHLPLVVNTAGQKLSKQNLAPPIPINNPVPTLLSALQLMGQNPDPHLRYGSAEEILAWAVTTWDPGKLTHLMEVTSNHA